MAAPRPEDLFATMALSRALDEALLRLFSEGRLFGTTHTSLGQEAVAAAVGAVLAEGDVVFAPHRCHAHFLAYGGAPEALLGEVMGREIGTCQGRGGSQHLHTGRFFSSGVQGGIVGNAAGAALALKQLGGDNLAVVFLGDGTLGQGLVYETLNFAALQDLPILFVLENNRYAQSTPVENAVAGSMSARAAAFGIDADEIESNDAEELCGLFAQRAAHIRESGRPFFQVVHTYRLGAHSKGDDVRAPEEIARWRERDPLTILGERLPGETRRTLIDRAESRLRDALEIAEAAPPALSAPEPRRVSDEAQPFPYATAGQPFVQALNSALGSLLEEDSRVLLLGEDLADPYGGAFSVSRGLSTRFPDRVISCPISEAGMAAWATGAALLGMRPVIEIMFGDFLALAADQIVNHAAKYPWICGGESPFSMVLRTPMGGGRGYGPTHSQSLEKLFLGVPGLLTVAPSHLLDPGALLRRASEETTGPVLFVEHKGLYPEALMNCAGGRTGHFAVRTTDSRYPTLRLSLADFETPQVTLLTYGRHVATAMEAAATLLLEDEVLVDVVAPSLLAPLPLDDFSALIDPAGAVVTLEEGSGPWGWGAEVIAAMAERQPGRVYRRIAAAHTPIPAAGHLEAVCLPHAASVVEKLRKDFA